MSEPVEIDTTRPHSARVWNYWLGGKDNYRPDREVGDAIVAQNPAILEIARHARQFLIRVVTYLAEEHGVDQFLDIGTGLPTMQNTHEVAQAANPAARVLYVDNDPLVLAHANALLTNVTTEGRTWYVHADVREPQRILEQARERFDPDRPVAIMLLGILGHAAPEFADMLAIVRTLVDAVPSGSFLVLQDGSDTSDAVRTSATMNNYVVRSLDQFRECFAGLEIVEPGLVPTSQWRPVTPEVGAAGPVDSYGAVGRKP